MLSGDLHYKVKLDTQGSFIAAGYGTLSGYIHPLMNFNNTIATEGLPHADQRVFMRGRNELKGRQHIFKVDFSRRLNADRTWTLGGKHTMSRLLNHARYDTVVGNRSVKDTARTSRSDYREDLSAFYLGIQYKKGQWGLMAGLRTEHTAIRFKQGPGNKYNNYLPNIAVSYRQAKVTSLLKLTTTLSRPSYSYLNNGKVYINDYSYRQGNISLKPSRQYRISLENHLFGFLDLSLGYIRIQDQILTVGRQIPSTPEVVLTPRNAADVNDYYANISVYYDFSDSRWRGHISSYGEVYDYRLPDHLNEANVTGLRTYGTLRWVNEVRLTKKIKLEASLFLRSGSDFYQVHQRHRWQSDLGLDYTLNPHVDLSLKYYDLFSANRYDYTKFYDQYKDHYLYNPHINQLRFSVVYRFNTGTGKIKKIGDAANDENRSRFE